MKIFEDVFKLNKLVSLKNKSKVPFSSSKLNTNSYKKYNYTPSIKYVENKNQNVEMYVYKNHTFPDNNFDADYISENFEKDLRRYPSNIEIESGGNY